jgi:hypothetical protein
VLLGNARNRIAIRLAKENFHSFMRELAFADVPLRFGGQPLE